MEKQNGNIKHQGSYIDINSNSTIGKIKEYRLNNY